MKLKLYTVVAEQNADYPQPGKYVAFEKHHIVDMIEADKAKGEEAWQKSPFSNFPGLVESWFEVEYAVKERLVGKVVSVDPSGNETQITIAIGPKHQIKLTLNDDQVDVVKLYECDHAPKTLKHGDILPADTIVLFDDKTHLLYVERYAEASKEVYDAMSVMLFPNKMKMFDFKNFTKQDLDYYRLHKTIPKDFDPYVYEKGDTEFFAGDERKDNMHIEDLIELNSKHVFATQQEAIETSSISNVDDEEFDIIIDPNVHRATAGRLPIARTLGAIHAIPDFNVTKKEMLRYTISIAHAALRMVEDVQGTRLKADYFRAVEEQFAQSFLLETDASAFFRDLLVKSDNYKEE